MKKIIILCVIIFSYHIITAQNTISGTIINQDSIPLIGASISIPELNENTKSDNNGHYTLHNIPNGKIKIEYSFIGYNNEIKTIILHNTNLEILVMLQQTVIEVEEIVVSGAFNSTQHSNAVKIDVIKLNSLSNSSSPNFTELLTKVPGIDMISKGSGVSKPVIRGLSMNDVLVLNNGVRFENYQYSSHHPLGIDEFGIENVEIIKGPASLLYGSDAIGGVINFIKEKPAPKDSIMGDYNLQLFSNTLGVTNNLGIKANKKNMYGGIRIGQKTNSDFLQGGGEYAPNSRFNEYSAKVNVGFIGKVNSFKLFYDHNNQKLGLVEEEAIENISQRGRKNDLFYQELTTDLISSQNKFTIGKMKLDINSAYQNTELIHFAEPKVYEIQMNLGTLTYETKLHLPSDINSEYIVGFQGVNQINTNLNNRETKLLPNANINNYSIFCLLQKSFFKNLKIQTGIRYDYKTIVSQTIGVPENPENYRRSIDKSYGSYSGSLGATYNFSKYLFFRGNIASAFRTPNLAELTSNGQHETRYEVGDNKLVPENSYEGDLSLHYHKDNITFDIAGFYNIINNYIYISPIHDTSSTGIPIYKYMQNNSILTGGEIGFHIHPKIAQWLHFESSFSTVIGKQQSGEYLPFVPANKWQSELCLEKEKLFGIQKSFISLNSHIAFNQNNVAPEETNTSGYTLFDIKIGGNLNVKRQLISIGFSANNIFDIQYVDHLSTLNEVNIYNPGRNVSFSLKIPFGVASLK